ncbi:hypothetical protein [Burkholderia ubonensis]
MGVSAAVAAHMVKSGWLQRLSQGYGLGLAMRNVISSSRRLP